MADSKKPRPILFKTRSWSPDIDRDKEWEEIKIKKSRRYLHRPSRSADFVSTFDVTDDDIKELSAVFELGFGLDKNNELNPKVKRAFPALELYAAVSRSSSFSLVSCSRSSLTSRFTIDPKEDPKMVKLRLKGWAQVIACSVREASKQPSIIVV